MTDFKIWVCDGPAGRPSRLVNWDEAVDRMVDSLVADDYTVMPSRADVAALLRCALGISDDR